MKKLNRNLIILASISFLIFLSSIFFSKSEKSLPKKQQTALLNPKYKEQVCKIQISNQNESIVLQKNEKFWFASNDISKILVDSKLVEILLDNASKIKDVYEISKSKLDWQKLELSYSNSISIDFLNNEKSFSKIFFGISDSLSNRIAFRTEINSYEIENNFSQFLTFDLNYWSAGEIFYEIKNPQTIKFDFPQKNLKKSINSSDSTFSEISHSILSIRHGKIIENKLQDLEKIAEIEVQDGNGNISKAIILKNELCFFVQKVCSPQLDDNSLYEISEWTFKKICAEFEKSDKSDK